MSNAIEMTGESIEDAIAKGLAQLGVGPSEVIIEVLEEPNFGGYGGDRPARVRLQLLAVSKAPPTQISTPLAPTPISTPPAPARTPAPARPAPAARPPRPPKTPAAPPPITATQETTPAYMDVDDEDPGLTFLAAAQEVQEAEIEEEAQVAKVVLGELLERMGVTAEIVIRRATPGAAGESAPWILDVAHYADVTKLVGRRGETLASLQYLTRLITSRELQRRAEVIVDVDGYKVRRARALHGLAQRMADEAVQRNRTVALEPMPPHERRIIHLALRERDDVVTRSIGEGVTRKVTIVPKSLA